jgi:CRISPR-associated endoribonuclease Cas6
VTVPDAQPADSLIVNLLSPTQINSQARRQASLPLTLSSIVKSLQQRLTALEPDLAAQFEFDGPAWQHDVRAFWPHQIAARHDIHDRAWVHQSRNTRGPILKHAVTGSMEFVGPVAASVIQLLAIGQWLAIGQSCSLGQGWYRISTKGGNTLSPPLLPAPWKSE